MSYYIFYTDGNYILQILASRVLAPPLPNSLLLIFERILVICCDPTPNKSDSSEGMKCSFTNMATRYSLSVNPLSEAEMKRIKSGCYFSTNDFNFSHSLSEILQFTPFACAWK